MMMMIVPSYECCFWSLVVLQYGEKRMLMLMLRMRMVLNGHFGAKQECLMCYMCLCVCCRRTSGHTMLSYQRLVYRLGCSRKIAGGLGGTHRIPTPGGRWWRGVDDGRPGHQVSCTEVRHLRRTRSRWRQGHPRLVPCCLAWVREADVVFSEARTGVTVISVTVCYWTAVTAPRGPALGTPQPSRGGDTIYLSFFETHLQ